MARYANRATANSLTVGDRIQVTTGRSILGDEMLVVTPRKTGVQTLAVQAIAAEVAPATTYRGRAQRWYLITTSAGVLRMAPAEVAHFAGEDATAVKRAHAEALLIEAHAEADRIRAAAEVAHFASEAPASTRPITFPQVAHGTRVNAETGIEIHTVRGYYPGGRDFYTVWSPSRTSPVGAVRFGIEYRTLAEARKIATAYAEDMRADIAAAHAEAVADDDDMAMARVRQASDWGLRFGFGFFAVDDMPAMIDADHAEALTEGIARDARRTQDNLWAAAVTDEAEAVAPKIGHSFVTTSARMLAARNLVEGAHAEAVAEDDRRTSDWGLRHADHAATLTEDIARDINTARTYREINAAACRFQDAWAASRIDDAQYVDLHVLHAARLAHIRTVAEAYTDAIREDDHRAAVRWADRVRQLQTWRLRHNLTAVSDADRTDDARRDADHAEALDVNAARDALTVTMTCCGNTYPNVVATIGHSCPVVAPQLNRASGRATNPAHR